MNKCYGYGRHSTAKQGLTKDAQEASCYGYWEHNLRRLGVEWGGFFYDAAVSAKKPMSERPEGMKLYFACGKGDHIVTAKYDRCFRSVLDGLTHLKALEDRGVMFHSDREKIDTSTAMGRAFRAVLLIIAEIEREMARERTLDVMDNLIAQGKPHCKGCPIGWRIVKRSNGREYRVDDDERRLARALHYLHHEGGVSFERLVRWVRRQTDYKVTRGFTFPNKVKWAVMAKEYGFPLITNYRDFFRMAKAGELDDYVNPLTAEHAV